MVEITNNKAGELLAPPAVSPEEQKITKFWCADAKDVIKIHPNSFRTFLIESQVGWYRKNKDFPKILTHHVDKVLKRIDQDQIVQLASGYIHSGAFEDVESQGAFDALIKTKAQLFSKELLNSLPYLNVVQLSDTENAAFFCYENTIVSVAKGGCKPIPYGELNAAVFEDDIIDREFDVTKKVDVDGFHFNQFLKDISRDLENAESSERYNRLRTIIGYMLHRYKNPAIPVAPFLRESIESKTAEGGTGKGIVIQALMKMRNVVDNAGKQFTASDNFPFETIMPETDVFVINDIKRGFSFETLFNAIADDITINRKFVPKYTVSFNDSPKFILTSNYAISMIGNSIKRRSTVYKVSRYYGEDNIPSDKFGRTFFKGWESIDWECFDSLMLGCVVLYLNHGILTADPLNTTRLDIIAETSEEFVDFAEFYFESDEEYDKKEVYSDFYDFYPGHDEIPQATLTIWIQKWAQLNDRKAMSRRSNGKDYIKVEKPPEPENPFKNLDSMIKVTHGVESMRQEA